MLDKGKCAFLILLDLSATFDTVDHTTLLEFLYKFVGLDGEALSILKSYLTDRTQGVLIDNVLSSLSELFFGVPQGSVLGPLIFCIYTLPLGAILRHHQIHYSIYADDTQLFLSFDSNCEDEALQAVTKCIEDIRTWMIDKKLKINDDKTEFLVLSSVRSKVNLDCALKIGQSTVLPSKTCKNLGVAFDQHLDMHSQISAICRGVVYHLKRIGSIRSLLPDAAAAQLVHSLVTARLDYCNSLLYNLPDSQLNRLQRVQNIAARIVSKCPKFCHMTPILQDLHWLPVKARIIFKILLLTYRSLHGTAPEYLSELVSPYSPSCSLRPEYKHLLVVPKVRLKTLDQQSFSFGAATE